MRGARTAVIAMLLVFCLGCGSNRFLTTDGAGESSAQAGERDTPLEILADVSGFELHSTTEGIVPTMGAPTLGNRLIMQPTETVAGFPTIEYRYECSNGRFAQVFVFHPSPDSLYLEWDTHPAAWQTMTEVADPARQYGAPLRGVTSDDLFSHEYTLMLSPIWMVSGGAIGTEVEVDSVGGTVKVLFSSAEKFLYSDDAPKPESPSEGAFTDPFQSSMECTHEAWGAASSVVGS